MAAVFMALGAFALYIVAYYTYGRWLARRIFQIDPEGVTPAVELEDGVDYVPSRKEVVFGHHFTSIAGTGPIVGPAIAIIWGWLPALLWVLLGSILMGAVHDFGALVISLRHKGVSIADLTGAIIGRRARVLFMAVVFFELLIVVAIFALVIPLGVLLFGNVHLIHGISEGGAAHSLLGALSPVLLWCGILAGGLLLSRRRVVCGISHRERATVPLVGIWFTATVVSFSAFPRLPAEFMARYVTVALVPASILLGVLFARSAMALPNRLRSAAVPVLAAVVIGHGLTGFDQARYTRDFIGQIIVAYDRAREDIARTVRNSDVFLLDFTYGYNRPIQDGNRYIPITGRPVRVNAARPLYVLVHHEGEGSRIDYTRPARRIASALEGLLEGTAGHRVGLQPVGDYHGLTDGLYDRWIYRSPRSSHAILYRIRLDPIDHQEG